MANIPVISFRNFLHGHANKRMEVGKQVFDAFVKTGFVVLKDHDIDRNLIRETFSASKEFFAKPAQFKNQFDWTSPQSNRGYIGVGKEKLADGVPDVKETFDIGNEKEVEFPNRWPSGMDRFKSTCLDFFDAADELHLKVMAAIGLNLPVGKDYFYALCNEQHENLRLLHYPPCKQGEISDGGNAGKKRAGVHTDYGTITLLFQEQIGGLQVETRSGQWVPVPVIKDAVVVNVGDLLQRWSNNVLKSNPHQVVVDPTIQSETIPDRYSIAFFCNPNKDALIECLPGCYSDDKPPLYEAINAYEYLTGRLSATIY